MGGTRAGPSVRADHVALRDPWRRPKSASSGRVVGRVADAQRVGDHHLGSFWTPLARSHATARADAGRAEGLSIAPSGTRGRGRKGGRCGTLAGESVWP